MPEGAPRERVQARLADAARLLNWLQAQAAELFVARGDAAGAWAALEAGLLEVLLFSALLQRLLGCMLMQAAAHTIVPVQ